MRKFEKVSMEVFERDVMNGNYDELILPKRGTRCSAGYDFYSPISFTLMPGERKVIPTGIKVCMEDNEFLAIYVRSSLGFKYNLRLCNQVGIVDYDYYNNDGNEGHIFVRLQNHSENIVKLNKNDRYVQGIFQKYYIVDEEEEIINKRVGGLGSTNKGDDNNGNYNYL